ncbi:hypothetical protein [Neolewinella antarctica]|uniref:Regulator of replication initiation timing n=1 Tax=Neolewinella antarctica TaxID=442734 RepID=A0ABX0XEY4_9BACT|nr:hypothetical protein [Neolewinella antarctica]NJC27469.1 regulator of replication initiation timing [Neolewinella antarctica]
MSQDKFNRRELLEQYLLGLTSREQTLYVKEMLEKDPTLATELEELRERMSEYITEQGMEQDGSDRQRSLQDFHDLDHEMITAMTRRNHNLVIWRLALSGVCLLLLFLSGYLFRSNQNYRMEVDREKALHAQDDASAQKKIKTLEGQTVAWDSLNTQTIPSAGGDVLVHYLAEEDITFLDLSHLAALQPEEAYHLEMIDGRGRSEKLVVSDSTRLSLLPLVANVNTVRLWRSAKAHDLPRDSALAVLVARFPLSLRANALVVD